MARAGLTPERVVAEAAALADAEGLEAVSVAAVAARLGVRPPSLYNHVGGREAIVTAIGVAELEALAAVMARAVEEADGEPPLLAVSRAYRAAALARPGRYAATLRGGVDDARYRAAGDAVLDVLVRMLGGTGLADRDTVHAARALRATVHGFVALELAGGFAIPVAVEESFTWAVEALAARLAASP